MKVTTSRPFISLILLFLAAPAPVAAQNGFSQAEADGVKAFLQQTFADTNVGMVTGLLEKRCFTRF